LETEKGFFSRFNKEAAAPEDEPTQEQIKYKKDQERLEFAEKLRLFKFYLACDFYEDNIGKVEIL
jgi:hypothetical protein